MPKELVDEELRSLIEPLLPERAPHNHRYAGREPTPDRAVLTGIVFVRWGIAWNLLPQEMGCGSGTACRRQLAAWRHAGVCQRVHETLLAELRRHGEIDLTRALVDNLSTSAMSDTASQMRNNVEGDGDNEDDSGSTAQALGPVRAAAASCQAAA